jgi:hypothetical protein
VQAWAFKSKNNSGCQLLHWDLKAGQQRLINIPVTFLENIMFRDTLTHHIFQCELTKMADIHAATPTPCI